MVCKLTDQCHTYAPFTNVLHLDVYLLVLDSSLGKPAPGITVEWQELLDNKPGGNVEVLAVKYGPRLSFRSGRHED